MTTLHELNRVCVLRAEYLHGIGDGQTGVRWRDVSMHDNDQQSHDRGEYNADEVQTHRKPAHATAEQVVDSLVSVQQLPVSGQTHQSIHLSLSGL